MTGSTPRPIRPDEASLVSWMLTHASMIGPLEHLLAAASTLQVRDRCQCGCGSLAFSTAGEGVRCQPIAEAMCRSASGELVEVIVWGTPTAVTGLEVIVPAPEVADLPSLGALSPAYC